jgi:hypothetical protein
MAAFDDCHRCTPGAVEATKTQDCGNRLPYSGGHTPLR